MVFVVGIAAALALGVGYVTQQRVAATAPLADMLRFRLLLDLMRRPLWWVGLGLMIAGQLLAGLALHFGTVTVVEPLLSTSLLFALAFAALLVRSRISWQEVCGSILVSGALGVFIAVGDPHSSPTRQPHDAVITLAVCAVVGAVAVLVTIGKTRGLVAESVLLATGAGLLYGLQDASTRAALQLFSNDGLRAMLFTLWPYIVVGAGAIGLLLSQSAFKAARLDYSLPPIAAAEPLVGIALGVGLLGDVVSVTPVGLAAEMACIAAMLAGVVLIGRSPNLAGSCEVEPGGLSPAPASPEGSA